MLRPEGVTRKTRTVIPPYLENALSRFSLFKRAISACSVHILLSGFAVIRLLCAEAISSPLFEKASAEIFPLFTFPCLAFLFARFM